MGVGGALGGAAVLVLLGACAGVSGSDTGAHTDTTAPTASTAGPAPTGASAVVTSSVPPDPADLASLERAPVLDALGVAPWSATRTELVWRTSFEGDDDLAGSYDSPQSVLTRHDRWQQVVHGGSWAATGWLTGQVPATPEVDGPNHRGYPTVQLTRMGRQPCTTPCLIDLWVWLDVTLAPGEWFSLATFALEPSDRWARVVTVNVSDRGLLELFHVPTHGVGERMFATSIAFPMRQWVRVTTYLDATPAGGAAVVWQDGRLASAARVDGGTGVVSQAHFGLYAPPTVMHGRVVNDDLAIWRLIPSS